MFGFFDEMFISNPPRAERPVNANMMIVAA
jgi:hypothetical protein